MKFVKAGLHGSRRAADATVPLRTRRVMSAPSSPMRFTKHQRLVSGDYDAECRSLHQAEVVGHYRVGSSRCAVRQAASRTRSS